MVKRIFDTTPSLEKTRVIDNYLLPIGSVVKVNNEEVMIISRYIKDDDQLNDYIGVEYPIGLINESVINFNQEDIEQILHIGYESRNNINLTIAIKDQLDSHR